MAGLISEKFTLTTSTYGTPLVTTMKRYRRASSNSPGSKKLSTILLLGHAAGFSKEIWEPVIEDLFNLDDQDGDQQIREAWALDCQNHGEAAILNGDILARNPGLLTIYDYADAFATLYRSGLLGNLDKEFHKVVLIGHSASSVGVTLATSFFNPPSIIPFSSLILIDHAISTRAMEGRDTEVYKFIAAMTPLRRDIWDSREAAVKWLKARAPWNMWEQRVFDTYVKYGLTPLPTPYYPDKTSGVTLTTPRSGENIAFTGAHFSRDAISRLNQICEFVPLHLIYGARGDMFDREVQDSIVDPNEGRTVASVTRIKGAGHLVVHEAPTKLAKALIAILRGKLPAADSKL